MHGLRNNYDNVSSIKYQNHNTKQYPHIWAFHSVRMCQKPLHGLVVVGLVCSFVETMNQASNAKCHEALLRLQEEREPVATAIESESE